jgi:adenylate cyclase
MMSVGQNWATDSKQAMMEGGRLLALALSIDKDDPDALCIAGRVTSYIFGDVEKAKEMVDRAVALNPNSSLAWEQRGWTYEYSGKSEEAIESFERSIRLSPLDPLLFSTYTGISLSLISLGRFEEALASARKALRINTNFSSTWRCVVAALSNLGRDEEARQAAARVLELDPGFRISEWVKRGHTWRSPLYIEGVRKAGLPE